MQYSRTTTAHSQVAELMSFVDSGIEHCRAGRWEKGREYLSYVAAREQRGLKQAGLVLSYLGCSMARLQESSKEALALCERAVEVEFYQPENWANLAEVLMLSSRRREAIEAVEQGLQIDPQFERLHRLHEELGVRRRPVLKFLARSNPLNYALGVLRSQLTRPTSH